MIMDDERFAGWLRALGSGATRRGALGILAGLAGLGLSEVTTNAKRKSKDKVDVCHYDADEHTWVPIRVSQRAWVHGHSKHVNDFLRGDDDEGGCCNDSDCSYLNESVCYFGVCDQTSGTCRQVFTGDGGCLI
jgi:hypothetical protein